MQGSAFNDELVDVLCVRPQANLFALITRKVALSDQSARPQTFPQGKRELMHAMFFLN